jgi:hypothetical protein
MDIKHLLANEEERIFAIFAGRSGSGKSVAAASLPKPFQEMDFDLRANGIVNAVKQGWLNPDGIDIKSFDPLKGYIQIQEYLNLLYVKIGARCFDLKSVEVASLYSLCRLLELTALNSNDKALGHVNLAGLEMTGYGDFRFEKQAMCKILDHLRVFPCNVVLSTWICDKWGKKPGAKPADANTVVGETLNITANLAEAILGMFNDVYRFSKEIENDTEQFYVEFSTDFAKNSFGIPPGRFNITKKPFWDFFQNLVKSIKDGSFKKETPSTQSTGSFI